MSPRPASVISFNRPSQGDAAQDTSAAGPTSDRGGQPITDAGATAQPPTERETLIGSVTSTLKRIGQRLQGFLQWLWAKVKQVASKVWNAICHAFSAMFTFIGDVWKSLTGTDHAKFHMA